MNDIASNLYRTCVYPKAEYGLARGSACGRCRGAISTLSISDGRLAWQPLRSPDLPAEPAAWSNITRHAACIARRVRATARRGWPMAQLGLEQLTQTLHQLWNLAGAKATPCGPHAR